LIQENENYRQRGFEKFLDTVLSNYGRIISISNIYVDTLLYVLVIASVFHQVQIGFDGSSWEIVTPCALFTVYEFFRRLILHEWTADIQKGRPRSPAFEFRASKTPTFL
jgi:hypothetical protein